MPDVAIASGAEAEKRCVEKYVVSLLNIIYTMRGWRSPWSCPLAEAAGEAASGLAGCWREFEKIINQQHQNAVLRYILADMRAVRCHAYCRR